MRPSDMSPDDIWVITSYFNPCGYETRRQNFDVFVEGLAQVGARLLVIELTGPGQNPHLEGPYALTHLKSPERIWQKERLLNVAIGLLPPTCTKVVWSDCDLLFGNPRWLSDTSKALDHYKVVQPFATGIHLPRGQRARGNADQHFESFGAVFSRDPHRAHHAPYCDHGHTGFVWAARREILARVGLYDACLTGSGDHLMAHAFAAGGVSPCIPAMLGEQGPYLEHFFAWAAAVDACVGGQVGYVEGEVLHLWHGERADRRYRERNQQFKAFGFDPRRHIVHDAGTPWRWGDAPEALRAWSAEMFPSRREDGCV
ncbi:MAG: hypothetical protein KA712_07270 [Myxococcales bacterium]|nr:hypothetical protein [Myxococcales bacterium]